MNRIKGILAAGTLTGVVLITVLVLGLGNLNAQQNDVQTTPDIVVQPMAMPDNSTTAVTNTQDAQALQTYAQQLETALQTMQEREAAYQAQIDTANQTVIQLQDQLNAQIQAQPAVVYAQAAPATFNDDDDRYEHEEHEDHEEHEGFEHDDD